MTIGQAGEMLSLLRSIDSRLEQIEKNTSLKKPARKKTTAKKTTSKNTKKE